MGTRHRFVAVNQPQAGYPSQPDQPIPAFALIIEMKDRSLGKSVEALVRGAALIAGTQVKLKLVEENADGVPIGEETALFLGHQANGLLAGQRQFDQRAGLGGFRARDGSAAEYVARLKVASASGVMDHAPLVLVIV